jgi:hypothetical protein
MSRIPLNRLLGLFEKTCGRKRHDLVGPYLFFDRCRHRSHSFKYQSAEHNGCCRHSCAPMWAASLTPQPAAPSTGAPGTKGTSASAQLIRLRPFLVRDPQINNIEALRFLVPSDWHVKGGILWRHDRAILATAVLRVASPNGSEELNFLPLEQFAQSNPGWGFGIGSNYLGSELQPVMDPKTFVSRQLRTQ